MQRRKFSREFKLEAVRLVKDRGVAVARAARGLDIYENVLRKWIRRSAACLSWPQSDEAGAVGDLPSAQGSREAEGGARHPKRRPQPSSRGRRHEVCFHREAPAHLAGGMALRGVGCFPVRFSHRMRASRSSTAAVPADSRLMSARGHQQYKCASQSIALAIGKRRC